MVEKVLLLDVELDRESSASQLGKKTGHIIQQGFCI